MKIKKKISPHRNHDFHYFFVNRFFRTRYEKKGNSRYNTQKKFIITNKELESNY